MKMKLLGFGACMMLFASQFAHAQTLGGALNKVKNASKDLKSTKQEVEGTMGNSKSNTKDPAAKSPNSTGNVNNNIKENTMTTDNRDQKPQAAFIKDIEKPEEATEFNGNDPIFFVFDYGMDLQTFFDKYIVDDTSFDYKLSIKMENGVEIFTAKNFIQRYPVKESGPIVEFLQLGEKYLETDMKHLASEFPMAILEHLSQGSSVNLTYSFVIRLYNDAPPIINETGTLKYNYRVSDRKTLVNHLEGFNRTKYDVQTVDVAYTPVQSENLGKIRFVSGSKNAVNPNQPGFVDAVNLSSPFHYTAYLEQSIGNYDIANNAKKGGAGVFFKKFYIDNVLIANVPEELDEITYLNQTIYSDVLVPANQQEFLDNEMKMGVLAHVLSTLTPGMHQLKIEIVVIKSIASSGGGGQGYTYDNTEVPIATGVVNVQIDQAALNNYTNKYGRPKISKGVLVGQANLEKQVIELIKRTDNITPVYVYAADNWKITRDAFNQIISREARGFYVFKNSTGRCEIADFVIFQDYEGGGYTNPKYHHSRFAKSFKYAVCSSF